MVKKYKMVRVPIEAIKGFKDKKIKMEKTIKNYTGKVINVPMTKVMTFVANNPTEIHENQLTKIVRVKKIRRVKL